MLSNDSPGQKVPHRPLARQASRARSERIVPLLSQGVAYGASLKAVQPLVQPAFRQQFAVGASFPDVTMVQNQDLI